MNILAKILNKILADKIQANIKNSNQQDQIGFILERQGWFNIHKSINVINHKWAQRQKSYDHLNRS